MFPPTLKASEGEEVPIPILPNCPVLVSITKVGLLAVDEVAIKKALMRLFWIVVVA